LDADGALGLDADGAPAPTRGTPGLEALELSLVTLALGLATTVSSGGEESKIESKVQKQQHMRPCGLMYNEMKMIER
jgi:hypothetical protein